MKTHITFHHKTYSINWDEPISIAIPLRDGWQNPNAFFAPLVEISPVVMGDFIGDTQQGAAVNFKNVKFNPHGNGTHTECVGHIAREPVFLQQCLDKFFFAAQLISIYPQAMPDGDRVITLAQVREALEGKIFTPALIIRTLPNDKLKQQSNYSGNNPPYLSSEVAQYLAENEVQHLLIDLPSVDREEDGGVLSAHHAFWQYPHCTRHKATISELIYVPNAIKDGFYFLQFQITALVLDASPSNPVLYIPEKINI
ncbi:MAG: cyclase family protein [Chitinophagales bacterium]|nr:cyclase family protein [Bacteroidota bacterium]